MLQVRADWCNDEAFRHLLAALMPANRLALELSLVSGLRIGDVLSIKAAQLARRMTVREAKTGKRKTFTLPGPLLDDLTAISGRVYVFEGRTDNRRHRTREAVYKDLRRAARLFRIDGRAISAHVSPHTARKIYAVERFHRSGDIKRVQQLLNHSSEAVTLLYAMADVLSERRRKNSRSV